MDSTHEVMRDIALFSVSFTNLVKELEKELEAHIALIGRLEARIIELEQKGSQSVSIKIDGDIGERLDDIEQKIEALGERLDSEAHSEDDIREWAKDEAQEVLANASFSVTVD